MKQIVFILAVMLMGYAATAQTASVPAFDTAVDATADVLAPPANYFRGTSGTYAVGFTFKKGTGTPAGYAILQTKVGGNIWVPMTKSAADSFQITNVDSNHHVWFVDGKKSADVRIRVVPSGTQRTRTEGYFIKNL